MGVMYIIMPIVGGLVLLYFGAEGLVRGSSRLALRSGLSPLTVGLTVVAFGTSSPELAVSLEAAIVGREAIALGTVVGSNIANLALILGRRSRGRRAAYGATWSSWARDWRCSSLEEVC